MSQLYMLTITEPLKKGQRKRRVSRWIVLATSGAAVVPTFNLTHGHHLVPYSQVDFFPYDSQIVRLS